MYWIWAILVGGFVGLFISQDGTKGFITGAIVALVTVAIF